MELLENFRRTIEQNVAPIVEAGSNCRQALDHMTDLEQDMYEISSATVDHSTTLQETAQIDIAASREWFMFAIALGLAAIFYLVTHQRHAYVSRRDQHIRSFASLFAHMTRSRVTALRLFLENTGFEHPPREEMLKAARGAANELESINDGLLKIAFAQRDSHVLPLAKLLLDLKDRDGIVQLSVDSEAGTQPVPATQFQLILGELVQNALTARRKHRQAMRSRECIRPQPAYFSPQHSFFEVADNGVGMTPENPAEGKDTLLFDQGRKSRRSRPHRVFPDGRHTQWEALHRQQTRSGHSRKGSDSTPCMPIGLVGHPRGI
nr:hypothetical protein [Mesorhizobium sp.]